MKNYFFFITFCVSLFVRKSFLFQVDDLHYAVIRTNLKSKDCSDGLKSAPYRLYEETYLKLFTCVTLPSLIPGELTTSTIKIFQGQINQTEYYTLKVCPSLFFCEHTSHYGNFTLDPCRTYEYEDNKCHKENDGTYTIIKKYRTPFTPSSLYYLPHNYDGILSGLYQDEKCEKRIGYHFKVDKSYSYTIDITNTTSMKVDHKSCFEQEIKDSKKCRPVDLDNGKTYMKQACIRKSPLRYEWFWVGVCLIILILSICCLGACPCFCAVCDREGVKKKVVPEWQRTYTFIDDNDETLDAEKISINRLKGDVSVKMKRCVLIIRKLMEIWHVLMIGFMLLTSIFTVITYIGTVSVWVFIEYASMENIIVSSVMIIEFILIIPAAIFSCYFLCPSQVSDSFECFGPYCGGIFAVIVFNVYFFVFLVLNMYYMYYTTLLFGSGMVFFEDHVWVYMAVLFVKSSALLFIFVEIGIRIVKLFMGLKGILECISQFYITVIRFLVQALSKMGLIKRGNYYQPI